MTNAVLQPFINCCYVCRYLQCHFVELINAKHKNCQTNQSYVKNAEALNLCNAMKKLAWSLKKRKDSRSTHLLT